MANRSTPATTTPATTAPAMTAPAMTARAGTARAAGGVRSWCGARRRCRRGTGAVVGWRPAEAAGTACGGRDGAGGRAGGPPRADPEHGSLATAQRGAVHRDRGVGAGAAVVGGADERPLRAAAARGGGGWGLRAAHRLGAAGGAGAGAPAPPPHGLDHRPARPGPHRRGLALFGIGLLLGLGGMLAVAHRDTAWLLTPAEGRGRHRVGWCGCST